MLLLPLEPVVELYKTRRYSTGVDVAFFPKTEQRFENRMVFSLVFKVPGVLEAVNSLLAGTVLNVCWWLGGLSTGQSYLGAHTSQRTEGHTLMNYEHTTP